MINGRWFRITFSINKYIYLYNIITYIYNDIYTELYSFLCFSIYCRKNYQWFCIFCFSKGKLVKNRTLKKPGQLEAETRLCAAGEADANQIKGGRWGPISRLRLAKHSDPLGIQIWRESYYISLLLYIYIYNYTVSFPSEVDILCHRVELSRYVIRATAVLTSIHTD